MTPIEPSDAEVEQFIAAHPHGATADEIAAVLGVTRQRTFQIIDSAVAKLLRALRARGIRDTSDLLMG